MDKIILLKKKSLKASTISDLLTKLLKMSESDVPEGYTRTWSSLIDDLKLKKSMGISLDKYSEYITKESATLLSLLGFTKYVSKIDLESPRRDLLQIIVNNNSAIELVEDYYAEHDKVLTYYNTLSILLSNPNEYLIDRLKLSSNQLAILALVTRKYDLIDWNKVTRYDKLKIASENDDFLEYTNQYLWDTKFGFIVFVFLLNKNRMKFLRNHISIMLKKYLYGMHLV